jgi:hypothetical protein
VGQHPYRLEGAYPQRPVPIGEDGESNKGDENDNIDQENPNFHIFEAIGPGRAKGDGEKTAHDDYGCTDALGGSTAEKGVTTAQRG